jgi:hypothetical protein
VIRTKSQTLVFTFSNSGVVKTHTRNPELTPQLLFNPDSIPPTFSSLQIVQTETSGFELIRETGIELPEWIGNLKELLGIPSNALLRYLNTSGAVFGVRWQNYTLRFVGIVIEQPAEEECTWPFWCISDEKGNDLECVQVWYQRVSCLSTPVYCDVRWQPEQGETVTFPNLENARRNRDVTAAWRGRMLLRKLNPRGRPESSVSLTKDQFIERAPMICSKWLEQFGNMPTDVQLAEELHISRATLYRYMERYGLSLNQIRDTAIRMLIEPASF